MSYIRNITFAQTSIGINSRKTKEASNSLNVVILTQTKISIGSNLLDNLFKQRDFARMDKLRKKIGLTNDDDFLFLVSLSRTSFSTTTSC